MDRLFNRLKIDKKIRAGYIIAILLLFFSYGLTLYTNRQLSKQLDLVTSTNNIIESFGNLFSSVKDAETGFRGFLAIRDTLFLENYYPSRAKTDSIFKSLKTHYGQEHELNEIEKLIERKYNHMDSYIGYFNSYKPSLLPDSLRMAAYMGKIMMDKLRAGIEEVQKDEKLMLAVRSNDLARKHTTFNIITISSLIITSLFVVLGFFIVRRENLAKQEADEKVKQYQFELQERINELDKANKELINMRSLEKFTATGRIARTIAHEVRNPLTNINLATEQLNSIIQQNEDTVLYADMIKRNADRINNLVSELLNTTKMGEIKPSKESVNSLLDEALELAMDRVELKGLKLEKKYSTDICDVAVDKEKLKIAFLNLMVNAIEAMEPERGVLTLETKGENNKCVVIISDNGMGMDEETLQNLFEPYFTTKEKGTGLGLALSQNIILSHKGTIEVKSKSGIGTSFKITIDFA